MLALPVAWYEASGARSSGALVRLCASAAHVVYCAAELSALKVPDGDLLGARQPLLLVGRAGILLSLHRREVTLCAGEGPRELVRLTVQLQPEPGLVAQRDVSIDGQGLVLEAAADREGRRARAGMRLGLGGAR